MKRVNYLHDNAAPQKFSINIYKEAKGSTRQSSRESRLQVSELTRRIELMGSYQYRHLRNNQPSLNSYAISRRSWEKDQVCRAAGVRTESRT